MSNDNQPDHKTFDLADALTGRTYPTAEVGVYLDENALMLLSQANDAREAIEIGGDEKALKEHDKSVAAIRELLNKSRYVFHLKGVSRDDARNLFAEIEQDFPTIKDALGREQPNPAQDEAFGNRNWALYTEYIENAAGERSELNERTAALFRGLAPLSAIRAVDAAITQMTKDAQSGYNAAIQDVNFLSGA